MYSFIAVKSVKDTKWNDLPQESFVKSFLLFAGFKINTTVLYQRRVNKMWSWKRIRRFVSEFIACAMQQKVQTNYRSHLQWIILQGNFQFKIFTSFFLSLIDSSKLSVKSFNDVRFVWNVYDTQTSFCYHNVLYLA